MVAARVEAGFLTGLADAAQDDFLLCQVLPFPHEADAGDQTGVSAKKRIQIRQQNFADIPLEVRRVAAGAAIDAVGNGDRQANLRGHLRKRHGPLDVLQRWISRLRHHAGYSSRRRCGIRRWSGHTRP